MAFENYTVPIISPYEEQAVEEEENEEKRNGKLKKESFQTEKPVVKALKNDTFLIVCSVLIILALTVCSQRLPAYLEAVNKEGSAYGALVFVSLTSCVIVWVIAIIFHLTRGASLCQNLRCVESWKFNVKTGVLLGFSGLIMFYARDRDRVPCHLQEPLTILFLPAAFVLSLISRGLSGIREVRKLDVIFLMGAFFGLFLCTDVQLLDPAYCNGNIDRHGPEDSELWNTQTNALWAIGYVGGLALFAYVHVILERYLGEEMKVSDSSDDQEVALLIRTKKVYQKMSKCMMRVAWVQTFSLLTVLSLFWTDIFFALGKAGSIQEVFDLMGNTFRDHFEDVKVIESGWPLMPCYSLFLLLLMYTLPYARTETIVVTELFAIPLTILISAILGGFVTETAFTIVGLLLLLITAIYYYFQNIANLKRRIVYDEI